MTTPPFHRSGRVDRGPPDTLFFSHLRWDFVFQRPQQIASRWALDHRAWYWEEPIADATSAAALRVVDRGAVRVVVPHLVPGDPAPDDTLARLLARFVESERIQDPLAWYWTPMMRPFSRGLASSVIVWDCMDDPSAVALAAPALRERERELLEDADLVFTSGDLHLQRERGRHRDVRPFPSTADVAHFAKARLGPPDPADQVGIPRPRIGWFGVIDERTDLALLDAVAADRPDWQFVLLGPVEKVAPEVLPRRPNLRWLGSKEYADLPAYVAHWDVAMLPFAHDESTRCLGATKTPEYLAAGCPVVSTSIADVVRPYGHKGLVRIADGPEAFEEAIEVALREDGTARQVAADALLAQMSWDETVARMEAAVGEKRRVPVAAGP